MLSQSPRGERESYIQDKQEEKIKTHPENWLMLCEQ